MRSTTLQKWGTILSMIAAPACLPQNNRVSSTERAIKLNFPDGSILHATDILVPLEVRVQNTEDSPRITAVELGEKSYSPMQQQDEGEETKYIFPIIPTAYGEGKHRIKVLGEQTGKKTVLKESSFIIDNTPPQIHIEKTGEKRYVFYLSDNNPLKGSSLALKLAASDELIDEITFTTSNQRDGLFYSEKKAITLSNLIDKNDVFTIALDHPGNITALPLTQQPTEKAQALSTLYGRK